ncbi:MAG: hypothetical protein IJH37_12310 [Clostridia bacterium]|nr:hypothetical protein [Clostridia bacterium]
MGKNKKRPDTEDIIALGMSAAQSGALGGDAVSSTEMTGLIPSIALDEFEADSYEAIEDYKA